MATFFYILKYKLNFIKRNIFLFLFLIPALENSSAQELLTINSIEKANEQIENYLYLFEDTSSVIDIRQISEMKKQNLLFPLKQFNQKRSPKHTYWLYFSIDNNLENDYSLGLVIPKKDHLVDIYSFADSVFFTQKTGMFIDGGKNDEILPFSNIIQIKDAKKIDFYLKIKNINDELPVFSLKFVDLDKAIKQNSRLLIFDGFAIGMMWLMIFYGLFLFFLNKDKLYLYYSLYIIFVSVWYFGCFALGYRLFPEIPRKIFPYTDIPIYIAYFFYIQFVRFFINTSRILPNWDKILKLYQIILSVTAIVLPIFIYLTNLIIVNYIIGNIIAIGLLVFSIILIIKFLLLKKTLANIIAIGSFLMTIGALLTFILYLSSNFANENVFIFQKVGFILELLVFTFGISFRYALIETDKQKFQNQLIVQLSENADLHEKVNKELADKVKERTLEIEQQRDIVIAQKDQIEKINTEITDSIRYAKYIQSSILPKAEQLDSCLGEHFVLYKPKDIVSGDFYWISNIENKTIITAADCTGHGVPGAFMSMLGTALLNEIINKEYITHPGVILRRLRKEVINSLQQKGARGEQKDGMDIAMCTIDLENMKLQFAGANNPLYLIRKSDMEKIGVLRCELTGDDRLYEIKGDPMPIGINERMENFTFHEIDMYKGDSFYLFTDGFPDQFGGMDCKKFGYRQFREQLLKNSLKTMQDQKIMLEKVLNEWMGDNSQVDDILIIGFRIS
jgi:serine phosphatase RsbU (regulator of sigma subunit)